MKPASLSFGVGSARVAASALALMTFATVPLRPAHAGPREDMNKRTVLQFYAAGLQRYDFAAAVRYLDPHFVQHNPSTKDGIAGFKTFVDFMHEKHPNTRIEVVHAVAEGDFVVLHIHATLAPGDRITAQQDPRHRIEYAVVDIYRLRNNKIFEHWDVIQEVPAKSENANGMFGPDVVLPAIQRH